MITNLSWQLKRIKNLIFLRKLVLTFYNQIDDLGESFLLPEAYNILLLYLMAYNLREVYVNVKKQGKLIKKL